MVPAEVVASNTTPHPVRAISAGTYDICAIREDGALGCWGGQGERPPSGTFIALANGEGSACAVRTNGRLVCWGDIGPTVPQGRFTSVSVTQSHACAVGRGGGLVCWRHEWDDSGEHELGIAALPHPAGTYSDVSLGDGYNCAIESAGGLACWSWSEQDLPRVSKTDTYVALDVPCAVRAGGELDCHGWPERFDRVQMGDRFVEVSASPMGDRICALRTDGTLACWGGEGWDDATGEELPMRVPAGRYVAVTVGDDSACATRADGRAVCWGAHDENARPAPNVLLSAPEWTDRLTIPLRWSAIASFARIVSFDVERIDKWDEEEFEATATTPILEATTLRGTTYRGEAGSLACWRARAHDADGIVSPWTAACTKLPDDDEAFTRSSGWATVRGSAYYLGSALRAAKKGATLSMTVDTYGIGIMATTCSTCGTIQIYVNGEPSGRVSLRSSDTAYRKVVYWSDNGEEGFDGAITIEVTSKGRPVIIDGIVLDVCPGCS